MIRRTFREAGIAEDMFYLGLVERIRPSCVLASRGRRDVAVHDRDGPRHGPGVDWWVDERRDPMRRRGRRPGSWHRWRTSSGRSTSRPPRTMADRLAFHGGSLVMPTTSATTRATTSSLRWRRPGRCAARPRTTCRSSSRRRRSAGAVEIRDNARPGCPIRLRLGTRTAEDGGRRADPRDGASLDSLREHNPHLLQAPRPLMATPGCEYHWDTPQRPSGATCSPSPIPCGSHGDR
jgi:hypothetical protein